MSIICSVDYITALNYKGANLSTKYNNKKHKVYLKLICDDLTLVDAIELAKVSKNILMIDYQGLETNTTYIGLTEPCGVYIGRVIDFGNNITLEDVERIVNDTPAGVTPIINLPNDYKDLHFLWQVAQKFGKVRFCGGKLFAVDGVKIGAIGVDILDKLDIKYDFSSYYLDGTIDVLENVDISSLEIDTTTKPENASKGKSKSSSSTKSSAPKKPAKKSVSFGELLKNSGFGGM